MGPGLHQHAPWGDMGTLDDTQPSSFASLGQLRTYAGFTWHAVCGVNAYTT